MAFWTDSELINVIYDKHIGCPTSLFFHHCSNPGLIYHRRGLCPLKSSALQNASCRVRVQQCSVEADGEGNVNKDSGVVPLSNDVLLRCSGALS